MSILHSQMPLKGISARPTQVTWWGHVLWLLTAAILSWAVSTIFAGVMQLSRPVYLVPCVGVSAIFLVGYLRWGGFDWRSHLVQNWAWGLFGAFVVGAFVVFSVLQQARTPMPQGGELLFNLLWLGVAYGLVDGLLLSVMPVVATWQACQLLGWTTGRPGQIASGALALLASLLVTATYHLGYPEFQGMAVLLPIIGVGLMSVAYLLSRSPLAPVLSHITMHVAAVLFGLYTAVQLPPHY